MQAKNDLTAKLREAKEEIALLRDQLEEEEAGKSELQRNFAKASTEASQYRTKFEGEKDAIEELEEAK